MFILSQFKATNQFNWEMILVTCDCELVQLEMKIYQKAKGVAVAAHMSNETDQASTLATQSSGDS